MDSQCATKTCLNCVVKLAERPQNIERLLKQGITTLNQAREHSELIESEFAKIQLEYNKAEMRDKIYCNKHKTQELLRQMPYPLYFISPKMVYVDEPEFFNQARPVGISMDYKESAEGDYNHIEVEDFGNPDKIIAAFQAIPQDATIICHCRQLFLFYIKSFHAYRDYAKQRQIMSRVTDFSEFMKQGAIYNNGMLGKSYVTDLLIDILLKGLYDTALHYSFDYRMFLPKDVVNALSNCNEQERKIILKYFVTDKANQDTKELIRIYQKIVELAKA